MSVWLDTPRLQIRPFTPADQAGYFQLNHIPETIWLGENAKHRLALGRLACVHKQHGSIIGTVGLRYLPEFDAFDIGYRIDAGWQRAGYAREACQAMVAFCRQRAELSPIIALVMPDNGASVRVLTNCGFVYQRAVYSALFGQGFDQYWLPG